MKKADSSGASFALIIGPDELARQEFQLKDLRGDGKQYAVAFGSLMEVVINALVASSE